MNKLADNTLQRHHSELQVAWVAFERASGLRPLKTDADHEHALGLLHEIWNVVEEDDSHPLASLFELLVEMISEYENKRYPQPACQPHEMLTFMMDESGKDAEDLAEILDSLELQEILNGRRKIDVKMAEKFARHFGVPPQLFMPTE